MRPLGFVRYDGDVRGLAVAALLRCGVRVGRGGQGGRRAAPCCSERLRAK
jgi:hypothetical protein